MTSATVATLAAQIDPMDINLTEQWPWDDGANPDLWMYRDRTIAILKRYMRLSVEVGRLPSLLGREFFRTRVTSYHVATFEDTVIFVHDVERMLGRLDPFSQKLIAKIVLQEYTQDEAAELLGCWRRTVGRRFPEAIDRLSEMFLEGGMLTPVDDPKMVAPESCQEAKMEENLVSDWSDGE
jgi:DNA-directed RNA polymerase specialized sigma24 family protein